VPLKVNHELIPDEVLRDEIRMFRARLTEEMPGESPAVLEARAQEWGRENVIEKVLLRQAALADTEPVPREEIHTAVENAGDAELEFRIRRMAVKRAGHIAPPRNKDIVDYYRKHREEMFLPEAVHAAHIVKNIDEQKTEQEALAAIHATEDRIKAGEAFEAVADELSDCPGRGGDLGWFPRGQMVPEFDAVVFALDAGAISAVFRTPFGFHIAKVQERRVERLATLEEVRPQIEQVLMAQKYRHAVDRFCDYLRSRATVEEL